MTRRRHWIELRLHRSIRSSSSASSIQWGTRTVYIKTDLFQFDSPCLPIWNNSKLVWVTRNPLDIHKSLRICWKSIAIIVGDKLSSIYYVNHLFWWIRLRTQCFYILLIARRLHPDTKWFAWWIFYFFEIRRQQLGNLAKSFFFSRYR